MKILNHRQTRRFVALLVGCECGRKFLYRLNRPKVACLSCGATGDMERLLERFCAAAVTQRVPTAARRSRRAA